MSVEHQNRNYFGYEVQRMNREEEIFKEETRELGGNIGRKR